MEQKTPGPAAAGMNPWDYTLDHDRLALPTVLVVEDDRDIREMVATLLDLSGFAVVACDTAERGLNALREHEVDLVLTDYALPRQSGLWLLQEAESEGLIEGTPVLIMTAHPHVDGGVRYEVIQKPFDLDELIERVRLRMEAGDSRRRRAAASGPARPDDLSSGDSGCPDPVEMILYVNEQSAPAFKAVEKIRKVLERLHGSRVKLTVCEVSQPPNAGSEASPSFAPTLVRQTPGPRTFILGHVTNPELLLELLDDCDAKMN